MSRHLFRELQSLQVLKCRLRLVQPSALLLSFCQVLEGFGRVTGIPKCFLARLVNLPSSLSSHRRRRLMAEQSDQFLLLDLFTVLVLLVC